MARQLISPAEAAAIRAVHNGLEPREAIERFAPDLLGEGTTARGALGQLRARLVDAAKARRRNDLIPVLERVGRDADISPRRVQTALDALAKSPVPTPAIIDPVEHWLEPASAQLLRAQKITTLAELTVRVPRLRRWWRALIGLGPVRAKRIETFFAAHPSLTAQARELVRLEQRDLIPWERLQLPRDLDGSRGTFRAPPRRCVLSARNDYEAVQAWLDLHESAATQRAYRKEVERLMLWAMIEQGKALSSLTTEDAVAYRAFLRNPRPAKRWVGPVAPRTSPQWRPFQGPLSARSAAYAMSVLTSLFRWLNEKRYLAANAFAGVRVKAGREGGSPRSRSFNDSEWQLIRSTADTLEDKGWQPDAAQRMRFILDFAAGTGLRNSELVRARLGKVSRDEHGHRWIDVVGKGNKAGRVVVPPTSSLALDRYLVARGLSTQEAAWPPTAPVISRLGPNEGTLTGARLWAMTRRFFRMAAAELDSVNRPLSERLLQASPHWMRHTHATHALDRGASLVTVRDNLRHASISTTSVYVHTDELKRAQELSKAFGVSETSRGRV